MEEMYNMIQQKFKEKFVRASSNGKEIVFVLLENNEEKEYRTKDLQNLDYVLNQIKEGE